MSPRASERIIVFAGARATWGSSDAHPHCSWACNMATREMRYSSEEHSRLYCFDPDNGYLPSRIVHRDATQKIEVDSLNSPREAVLFTGKDFEARFRTLFHRHDEISWHGFGHPVFQRRSAIPGEFGGILIDVTERRLSRLCVPERAGFWRC